MEGRNTQITEPAMATFSKERENFVYVAKLAEQAERYDGSLSLSLDFHCEVNTRSGSFILAAFHFQSRFHHLLQLPIFSFSL